MSPAPPVPGAARRWVEAHSRQTAVVDHGFDLDLDWWVARIGDLPGGPVTAEGGETSGRGRISRALLFSMADGAVDDDTGEGALRLLWPTLLWGTGDGNRNNMQRINAITENPQRAGLLLRDAARLSREHPREAFTTLRPGRNAIRSLGPAFFTKFLYFAGGGRPDHPCLIVDLRVLTTLWRDTSEISTRLKPRHNYGLRTYLTALDVLTEWASELSAPDRPVASDEVERWAFAPAP